MFKKILPILLVLAFIWAASPALAENGRRAAPNQGPPADNHIYNQRGAKSLCYRGLNGRGEVIKWAKTREQCRNQTNGQSWGHSGQYENFYRDSRRPQSR